MSVSLIEERCPKAEDGGAEELFGAAGVGTRLPRTINQLASGVAEPKIWRQKQSSNQKKDKKPGTASVDQAMLEARHRLGIAGTT